MARTKQEIEQIIDDEVALYPQLNALQSNSSMVQFWKYCKKVVVFVVFSIETLFDKHKEELNKIIDNTETGSLHWYESIFKKYQHGDNLVIVNNRPVYSVINPALRIVERVALTENSNASITAKVVKEAGGVWEPLNVTELAGLTAYIQRRKIAGTQINIVSLPADQLLLDCEIVVDPLLFDSSGLSLSDGSEAIKNKIEAHLRNFDFGSVFYLSRLIDEVMEIDGVVDFFINTTSLGGTTFNRAITSPAGHIQLDNNSTINYVLS